MREVLSRVNSQIQSRELFADQLIGEIFESSSISKVNAKAYAAASRRVALGNPPGKRGSMGDAINWVVLLQAVSKGEDLHIISADGDFFSVLDESKPKPFLADEWASEKDGCLYTYRTLSEFMDQHFDGTAFSYDKNKEALIDSLWTREAMSFSTVY